MNYMLLIYHEEPPLALSNAKPSGCDGLAERLMESGRYVASGILQPTLTSTSLRVRQGRRMITDGPFAETREQLAGYMLVEAENLDEALRIAAEHPVARTGTVEVRPVQFSPDWVTSPTEPNMNSSTAPFVVTRTLDAPRDLVWRAWTEGDLLARWWGPKGLGTEVLALDATPGGTFHYAMVTPEGDRSYGRFTYDEIHPTDLLAFTNGFSNAEGEIVRAPFSSDWPLDIRNVVTFEETDGGTRVTLTGTPVDPTEAESRAFTGMFASMEAGFGGTFERLTDLLATMRSAA